MTAHHHVSGQCSGHPDVHATSDDRDTLQALLGAIWHPHRPAGFPPWDSSHSQRSGGA